MTGGPCEGGRLRAAHCRPLGSFGRADCASVLAAPARTLSKALRQPLAPLPPRRASRLAVRTSASVPAPAPAAQPEQGSSRIRNWALGAAALAGLAAAGYAVSGLPAAQSAAASLRHFLSSSVLAKSGFFAAFSLIFASEVGDKTFFIAALLAMRCGRWISFVGSLAALSVMTVVSVAIGAAIKSVPSALRGTEVLGQWVGAALLAYFGVRTLRDAWAQQEESEEELGEARDSVNEAARGGAIGAKKPWQALLEVATLIFVAEWGDRSMLATIALGAAQSPLGVAAGAVLAHAAATALAVAGGSALSHRISEKTLGYVGGCLFLVFAAATALGLF